MTNQSAPAASAGETATAETAGQDLQSSRFALPAAAPVPLTRTWNADDQVWQRAAKVAASS